MCCLRLQILKMSDIEDLAEPPHIKYNTEYRLPLKVDRNEIEANAYFYLEYVNDRKIEYRNCIECGERLNFPNSGTSSLIRHYDLCQGSVLKKRPIDHGQLKYGTFISKTAENYTGLSLVSKLVYEDNIPITRVPELETLQTIFRRVGFPTVTYDSLVNCLAEDNQSRLKSFKHINNQRIPVETYG